MKVIINRILIAVHAIIKCMLKPINSKKNKNDKRILIVFQQIFGDSVVISDSLKFYTNIFPKEKGYEIIFLARPSVLAFMSNTLPLLDDISFEALDFRRYLADYRYFKSCNKKFKNDFGVLIVPGTSLSAEIFAIMSNANRKIGLIRSVDIKGVSVEAMFSKHAYTETIRPDKEDMMLQRHRRLLNYLGANEYKAKLPSVLPKEKIVNEEKYCVLCPGSSKMEKCWPTERFSEIIDFIVEQYDMNIHLCGGAEESEFERLIYSQVKHPDCVISHIGKTSFSDWSAIVQHADLVVGNDSATMHLAAASCRKAICIAGLYDKYQFFPYKVDVLEDGDRLPNTIIKEVPCEWCRTVGYDAGFGNAECKKRIKNDQCALCIDAITVDDVKKQIRFEMEGSSEK